MNYFEQIEFYHVLSLNYNEADANTNEALTIPPGKSVKNQ